MADATRSHFQHPRILLAAVDHELSSMLARVLKLAGYDVAAISNRDQVGELLAEESLADHIQAYDLLICEAQLLDDMATRSIETAQKQGRCPPLILITAFADDGDLQRVQRLKTEAHFERAFETFEQLMTIRRVVPLQPGA